MPRGDKTGPEGKGPMTGRGLGACGNSNNTTNIGNGRGMGLGRGNGFGRGMGARRSPINTN